MKKINFKRFAKRAWKIVYAIFALIGLLVTILYIALSVHVMQTGEHLDLSISPTVPVDFRNKVEKLRKGGGYATDTIKFSMTSVQDTARAREIREYFQLDTLYDANASTWEKTLAVAQFVATNIPHANQNTQPKKRNAIFLWEYTKTTEPGFNCRLHSIMMFELLKSIDIEARFITCLPDDENDWDCHVMNHVWLPELGKWAMVDSDMGGNYATAPDGTPLSLPEIRQRYIDDEPVCFHPKFDEKGSSKISQHHAYIAKNSYWYRCWETLHYDQEPSDATKSRRMVDLVPSGFKPFEIDSVDVVTTDSAKFWAPPI